MAEWAKSRARAQHWVHEVRLVDAEMQRAIDFSESMAKIWDARRVCEATVDLDESQGWANDAGWADGARAYASKQAFIRRAHAAKWREEFAELRMEAQRFLVVNSEEGLSLDPSTLLPASEVEDMNRRTKVRREKRKKAKAAKDVNAEQDPANDAPTEDEKDASTAVTSDSAGKARSTNKGGAKTVEKVLEGKARRNRSSRAARPSQRGKGSNRR